MTESLTWTCHVCGETRSDEKISVYKRRSYGVGGVEFQENIRYCNDREACVKGAKWVSLVKAPKPFRPG